MNDQAQKLLEKIEAHEALVGIIGLGYVGLPLALAFTEQGFTVLGFDVDPAKVEKINRGESYIKHLDANRLTRATGHAPPTPAAGSSENSEFPPVILSERRPDLSRRSRKAKPEGPEGVEGSPEAGDRLHSQHSPTSGDSSLAGLAQNDRPSGTANGDQLRTENSELRIAASASLKLEATSDFSRLSEADAILICVPTPLGPHKEPDMRYVESSTRAVAATLRPGQLVILESTTYPGTTDDLLKPILESPNTDNLEENPSDQSTKNCDEKLRIENSELRIPQLCCGTHFFLAFSPEREDPGNPNFGTTNVPKVVGGVDPVSGDLAQALYDQIVDSTVRVASARIAEASKLTENIFRAVNIALVNELKIIFDRMGIDIWEVLDAAATKPFGFMRFNPGPGLGGHCIPLDPFYLAWKAREVGVPTKFIELAGEINTRMPEYVIEKLQHAMNELGKPLKGAKVLLLGLAYKPDIDDPRESPAFELIHRLLALGAEVTYHDPHISEAPSMRSWPDLPPMTSQPLTDETLQAVDAVLLATDHKAVDYDLVLQHAPLIIDTRGVFRHRNEKVWHA